MDKCNCTIEKFPKRPALSRKVSNYSYNCECISGFRLQKFPELFNRNTYWCNYSVTLSFTHSYLYSLLLSILHLCMHQLLYSLTHQFYHNWVKNPKKLGSFFFVSVSPFLCGMCPCCSTTWFSNHFTQASVYQFGSDGDILRCVKLDRWKMRPMVSLHSFPIYTTS